MTLDNVSFNPEWVASLTKEAFLKEMKLPCYAHIYPGDSKREKKLAEVHRLCTRTEAKDTEKEEGA